MNQFSRNAALWIFLVIMLMLLYNVFWHQEKRPDEITYSKFRDLVEQGHIQEVIVKEDEIIGKY